MSEQAYEVWLLAYCKGLEVDSNNVRLACNMADEALWRYLKAIDEEAEFINGDK